MLFPSIQSPKISSSTFKVSKNTFKSTDFPSLPFPFSPVISILAFETQIGTWEENMETPFGVGLSVINPTELTNPYHLSLRISPFPHFHGLPRKSHGVSVSRSSLSGSQIVGDEVMQIFIKERELNGDLISKASDALWKRGGFSSVVAETNIVDENSEVLEVTDDDNSGGFLKLTKTQEWVSGVNVAPVNKKLLAKKWQNDREMRKRLNLLQYDALKRELLLLTTGIGAACTGYCLVTLSIQAAISYAAGVLFRIGIRSEDLKNLLERTVKGSTVALSSPRLVIPAAIYGVWGLSHHFLDYSFDFQLAPAMFGMFAYKAAALVQVYRDNKDLRLVFPDSEDDANN